MSQGLLLDIGIPPIPSATFSVPSAPFQSQAIAWGHPIPTPRAHPSAWGPSPSGAITQPPGRHHDSEYGHDPAPERMLDPPPHPALIEARTNRQPQQDHLGSEFLFELLELQPQPAPEKSVRHGPLQPPAWQYGPETWYLPEIEHLLAASHYTEPETSLTHWLPQRPLAGPVSPH